MKIREATGDDFGSIWPMLREAAAAGQTYAFPRSMDIADAERRWIQAPRKTFVVVDDGQISGSYYLKTNHDGPGDHVCNCGYIVAAEARGRGLATLMCQHSQEVAVALGYKAMQFNLVAESNEGAVRLWKKLGFATVGRLPRAFRHPTIGYVDALIMYKWLTPQDTDPT